MDDLHLLVVARDLSRARAQAVYTYVLVSYLCLSHTTPGCVVCKFLLVSPLS